MMSYYALAALIQFLTALTAGMPLYSLSQRKLVIATLRRLPGNGIPDHAGFSFVIKVRQQAHSRTM
jgi:hypothetical protein